jgi:hypothetical protein
MRDFIDSLMRPNELVTNRTILRYDEVFVIYSNLVDLDQVFREMLQINFLKRGNERKAIQL